ncbi:SDR family NAD(P)-dependent oxidoreductase [Nocardia sp. CA-084685]|uniref:SDR family NAD(P)-dependent oxidoreductase n=1 Tax=Nocardia sp. CA-084685 TaxID=3239970 RepID=UPI003D98E753
MLGALGSNDLIIGINPFDEPNARLVVAVERAGGLGVLALKGETAQADLAEVCAWWPGTFGVRVPRDCDLTPHDLPERVDTVVLPCVPRPDSPWWPAVVEPGQRVLIEVISQVEARAAVTAGADGLIARGGEAGGRVGRSTTFVLMQQLLADSQITVPIWAAGGIGVRTAAAAIAGGAAGVVLDVQFALTAEMDLPSEVSSAIRAMDGSETAVVGGYRFYVRPDLPLARSMASAGEVDPETIAARLGASDLREQLLPVGQDAVTAAQLASRHVTAGGVVHAIRGSVMAALTTAQTCRPLDSGAAFAVAHGLRFPIAQGPMTHVSDRAAFASAVADAGGLPFLALSLLSGEKTQALLEQTAGLLGDRPWGAGILGFVPTEIREAQLAAILAVRPPFALIAGGRPSQSAELEAAGIPTFLHVPSPGLLDQFLAQGSRRFVFEGSECGGHVGPRSSFALWETQIERLLAFGTSPAAGERYFEELQILFAGGVHDERSAAMVAVLGAPLAERGAGLGVLMGTAYLFTEEAVASGAITSTFQRAALDCAHTVLLETSPGHSTRCVDTQYVSTFLETKRRLTADGVGQQQMWAELEKLNLGRLRIASKGLRRQGADIVPVDENFQSADGMFMIGDVATLRAATTTVERLHNEVSAGATDMVAARAAELGLTSPSTPAGKSDAEASTLDVAIVGIAGVFPQAGDTARYWSNVVGGVDAITEVSADRWDPAIYFDSDAVGRVGGGKSPSKWGGFLPDVPFDALAYGIPPASLSGVEPVQLLALEVATRALRDAGYGDREFDRQRTSVVFGTEAGTDLGTAYGFRSLFPAYFGALPSALDAHLPAMSEDSFPGVLGNVIAGRIANRLDLRGVNYTVDAACASSLAALDSACKELGAGTSDMVLCGGADTHNSIYDYLLFAAVGALSGSGRCRTFDAAADGIALGEAVGCLVLKRLADAERDGDRVYAVIKGIAGSSDGRSLGLTAPRLEGQQLAMDRAYHMAGLSPARLGLVEAHGTGTIVGDRTELAALTRVLTEAGATPGVCALGSVKSQIGHTKCAAGIASLIKVARAIYAGVRPPTSNITAPNGYWKRESSPFFFDTAARPWLAHPADRIGGVSSFGFGGTNFHAVLAGYRGAPEPAHGLDEWPAELFFFRGADETEAVREMDRISELIATNDTAGRPWRLRDLARTASVTPSQCPVRVAVVASDLDELAGKLARARAFEPAPEDGIFVASDGSETGQVAFLFPGQGSQRVGMLADLFVAFPRLRRYLHLGAQWYEAMFPPAAFSPEETTRQRATLTDTRVAQPALGVAEIAMSDLLATVGVRPDVVAGHSYGELVALCAADALDEGELLGLSRARGEAILAAAGEDPGQMAAVSAAPERVRDFLARDKSCAELVVANHNAPEQTVIAGATRAIETALAKLGEHGISATKVPVACAFHSPVVAAAGDLLADELGRCSVSAPRMPVWSNTTASPYPADADGIRELLVRQVAEPVRFVEQIETMFESGVRVFVEAGPGRVLTGLVDNILDGRPHRAIACDIPGEPGLRRLLLALAELAVAGVPVDPMPLFRGRDAAVVSASTAPRRPGWVVNGYLVRTADGQYLPGAFQPARELGTQAAPALPGMPTEVGAARDSTMMDFLRSTRELMAAQRDVMLGYLGAPVEPRLTNSAPDNVASAPNSAAPAAADVPLPTNGSAPQPDAPLTPDHALAALRTIVSERTGYPEDMLQADLDLEADLSIDSIKRTEILGALQERVTAFGAGLAAVDESGVEQLARLKTLRAIVDWLIGRSNGSPVPGGSHEAGEDVAPSGQSTPTSAGSSPAAGCERFVVEVAELEESVVAANSNGAALADRRFAIVEAGLGIDHELAALLERHGAQVCIVRGLEDDDAALREADTVVHLAAVVPGTKPVLPDGFSGIRDIVLGGTRKLLIATGFGGRFGREGTESELVHDAGLGLHGLVRALAREFPELDVRAVDIDVNDEPHRIASYLLAELLCADAPAVVGYRDGKRAAPRVTSAPLPVAPTNGDIAALGLEPSSVVLLTGGARGITSDVAIGLARATGCHIELVGRTPAPSGQEDPETAKATDRVSMRRVVVEQGIRSPSEVEAVTSRLLKQREIQATMAELSRYAGSVRYHAADVRDSAAMRGVVEDIYGRHGRLDGAVHGAGVLDDRLLCDKTLAGFERVFTTKVDGARALIAAVRPDLRFLVLFGSIVGVYGNRGQADYAAANDALDTMAHAASSRFAGRVVSVDWGPWATAEGGMVSAELEHEYARRGLGVIDHDDGVACLLRELAHGGDSGAAQIIYVRGHPEAIVGNGQAHGRQERIDA